MGRVAGVFDNPPGFPCTPPGVDVLEGGKLTSNNVAGSLHDPLQSPAVASSAVSKPGGDAAGQDALHSAGVEGSEDAGHSKLPQPSQEEEAKSRTIIHEQHPHIGVLIFQVGESSVQGEGNSIVCGTVTAVCKL